MGTCSSKQAHPALTSRQIDSDETDYEDGDGIEDGLLANVSGKKSGMDLSVDQDIFVPEKVEMIFPSSTNNSTSTHFSMFDPTAFEHPFPWDTSAEAAEEDKSLHRSCPQLPTDSPTKTTPEKEKQRPASMKTLSTTTKPLATAAAAAATSEETPSPEEPSESTRAAPIHSKKVLLLRRLSNSELSVGKKAPLNRSSSKIVMRPNLSPLKQQRRSSLTASTTTTQMPQSPDLNEPEEGTENWNQVRLLHPHNSSNNLIAEQQSRGILTNKDEPTPIEEQSSEEDESQQQSEQPPRPTIGSYISPLQEAIDRVIFSIDPKQPPFSEEQQQQMPSRRRRLQQSEDRDEATNTSTTLEEDSTMNGTSLREEASTINSELMSTMELMSHMDLASHATKSQHEPQIPEEETSSENHTNDNSESDALTKSATTEGAVTNSLRALPTNEENGDGNSACPVTLQEHFQTTSIEKSNLDWDVESESLLVAIDAKVKTLVGGGESSNKLSLPETPQIISKAFDGMNSLSNLVWDGATSEEDDSRRIERQSVDENIPSPPPPPPQPVILSAPSADDSANVTGGLPNTTNAPPSHPELVANESSPAADENDTPNVNNSIDRDSSLAQAPDKDLVEESTKPATVDRRKKSSKSPSRRKSVSKSPGRRISTSTHHNNNMTSKGEKPKRSLSGSRRFKSTDEKTGRQSPAAQHDAVDQDTATITSTTSKSSKVKRQRSLSGSRRFSGKGAPKESTLPVAASTHEKEADASTIASTTSKGGKPRRNRSLSGSRKFRGNEDNEQDASTIASTTSKGGKSKRNRSLSGSRRVLSTGEIVDSPMTKEVAAPGAEQTEPHTPRRSRRNLGRLSSKQLSASKIQALQRGASEPTNLGVSDHRPPSRRQSSLIFNRQASPRGRSRSQRKSLESKLLDSPEQKQQPKAAASQASPSDAEKAKESAPHKRQNRKSSLLAEGDKHPRYKNARHRNHHKQLEPKRRLSEPGMRPKSQKQKPSQPRRRKSDPQAVARNKKKRDPEAALNGVET